MKLDNFGKRIETGLALANMKMSEFSRKSICQAEFVERFVKGENKNPTKSNLLRFSRALGTRPYFFSRPIQIDPQGFSSLEEHYLYESWLELQQIGVELPEFQIGETKPFPTLLEKCTDLLFEKAIDREQVLNFLNLTLGEYRKLANRHLKVKVA